MGLAFVFGVLACAWVTVPAIVILMANVADLERASKARQKRSEPPTRKDP